MKSLFPVGKSLSLISSNEDRIPTCARILSSASERFFNSAEIAVRGIVQVANNIKTYASRAKKPGFLTRHKGCNEVFS
ncbi:hypothetical protein D0A34_25405 [Microcoleus vaginatus PCC 9802]|nr:hypothetical protein D0A34_25405 [Microcoleus vaginatus PCC 9802]